MLGKFNWIVLCLTLLMFLLPSVGHGQDELLDGESKSESQQLENSVEANEEERGSVDDITQGVMDKVEELAELEVSKHAGRISSNFLTLMKNSWDDVAFSVLDLIQNVSFYTLIFAVMGFALAIVSFLIIRAFGWTKFGWNYYWTICWILPLLFIVCFTFGFGYAGFFYGAKVYCKKMIEEEHIIERATMTMYCTMIMEHADYEATGEESVGDLLSVMDSADEYHIEFDDNLKDQLKANLEEEELGWFENFVMEKAVSLVDGKLAEYSKECGIDIRVFIVAFLNRDAAEKEFGEDKVKTAIALATPLFEKTREYAAAYVSIPLNIQYYAGLILGAGIPLGTFGFIHLTLFVVGWINSNFGKKDEEPSIVDCEVISQPAPAKEDLGSDKQKPLK